jgi:hypothetical protein
MFAKGIAQVCSRVSSIYGIGSNKGEVPTQAGDRVRFRVADVFLPSPEGLLPAPSIDELVEGTIVDFSDSGQKARAFALVDVIRTQTVVVPVENLEGIPPKGSEKRADV